MHFTQKELLELQKLSNWASEQMSSKPARKVVWDSINDKLGELTTLDLDVNISAQQVADSVEVMGHLDRLCMEYAQTTNITDVDRFIKLKLAVNGYLGAFTDFYGLVLVEANRLENVTRKYHKMRIIELICKEPAPGTTKTASMNMAKELVEGDIRYCAVKEVVNHWFSLSLRLRSKLTFYSATLKNISQSIATAKSERSSNQSNNN